MKRFLLTTVLLLGLGGASVYAQRGNTYNDDIYYSSEDAKADSGNYRSKRYGSTSDDGYYESSGDNSYGRNGNSRDYGRSYVDDYDNDYYYSGMINRFNYPFAYGGYWGGYYNPMGYNRFWHDPYWGYNPWWGSGWGMSMSFGMGPYWNSGWGFNSWFGYGGFNSFYNYPYYACGYGGLWGGGGWGGFYGNYWNGYYGGLYGSGFRRAPITYGPRYGMNSVRNSYIRSERIGLRPSADNAYRGGRDFNRGQQANGSEMRSARDRMEMHRANSRMERGTRGNDRFVNDRNENNMRVSGADRMDNSRQMNMDDRSQMRGRFTERSTERQMNNDRNTGGRFQENRMDSRSMDRSMYNNSRNNGFQRSGGAVPQSRQEFSRPAPSRSFDGGGGGMMRGGSGPSMRSSGGGMGSGGGGGMRSGGGGGRR